MITIDTLLRALGGERSGKGILCPSPGHSPHDRGMRVWPDPTDPLGFKVHLFNDSDWRAAKDHVAHCLGVGRRQEPKMDTSELAHAIYREAKNAKGTVVETYLFRRGLPIVEALRYHPHCPFGSDRAPAMIAPMVSIHDNTFQGIHRTPLNSDGSRAGKKMMMGPAAGAVVKLSPDEDVTTVLAIGEGIESSLSVALLKESYGVPTWACLSAGALAAFPVLSGVETLWIAVDNDDTGRSAARTVAQRWVAAGREVLMITPRAQKADINDVIR